MRLIDADALYEYISNKVGGVDCGVLKNESIAPTIDAVKVVRCRDCKWSDWYKTLNGEHRCYCMEHGSIGHTDDDYCSYVEREDGEE